ncbi:MAG: hypothetical protein RI949_2760 [Pseudomonadota bacterium]|jgi:spermidine synthase
MKLPEVTLSEHDGVRYLHLGTPWVQGAFRPSRPKYIELDYIQRMLSALLWLPTEWLQGEPQGHAVQLGLGAATLTRFTFKDLGWRTTAVELNPQVVSACRAYFALPANQEGLQVVLADAGDWVQQHKNAGTAQMLHVDLYDHEAAAPVLDDEAFYAHCRKVLAPGGVMAVNLFGRHASFDRSLSHVVSAFGADQVWRLQATREGNTVLVAGKGVRVPDRDALTLRADWIEARFKPQGLPAKKWLRMVRG